MAFVFVRPVANQRYPEEIESFSEFELCFCIVFNLAMKSKI